VQTEFMNEEAASQPSPVADLSSLERDLARSLQPSWVQSSGPSESLSRMTDRFGDGDRPARPERRGNDRRPAKRGPGGDGPRGKAGGGSRDRRDKRRDDRGRDDQRRPEPKAPEKLAGWEIRFVPDPRGLEGIARQIKASGKAYALFDLARLVLERPERYLVEFKKTADNSKPLWQLRTDGTLWSNRREAEAHALTKHLSAFYRTDRVQTDAPKGNYTCIAQCGMSGVLLGPPNHHEYQSKIRELHAKRFSGMSFETYKNRIQMVREEAVIQQWKDEQSFRLEYYTIPAGGPANQATEASPPISESEAPASLPVDSPTEAAPISENPLPAEDPPNPEIPVESQSTDEPAEVPAAESPALDNSPTEKFSSFQEVEEHFRKTFSESEVIEIIGTTTIPGNAATGTSAPLIVSFVRAACEELNRFPLNLAHVIGDDLHKRGLQIFKSPQKILHACVARPKPLDAGESQLADGLKLILETLAAQPRAPRNEQWKALCAHREDEAGRAALASDLAWLIRQGNVIDYAGRGFELPRREPPPAPKKKPA